GAAGIEAFAVEDRLAALVIGSHPFERSSRAPPAG
ncbi:MAG: hypothetical protein AVDCRST_MAG54-3516, partial [uncultured Actinomycetospora sp.]